MDRIDNDGDYEPGNVRWVTKKQNNRNTRKNKFYTINGMTKCLAELCEEHNKKYSCVTARLDRGWSIEDALSIPVNEDIWKNRKTYLGVEE